MDKIRFTIPQQEGMSTDQLVYAIRDYLIELRSNFKGTDTDFYIEMLRYELQLKEANAEQLPAFQHGSGNFMQKRIKDTNDKIFNPDYNHPDVVYYKWLLYKNTPFYHGFRYTSSWIIDSENYNELNKWEHNFTNEVETLLNLISRIESKADKKRLLADAIVKIKKAYNRFKDTFSRAYVMLEQIDRLEKLSVDIENETNRKGLAPKEGLTPEHFRKLYLYLIDDKRKWIEVRENSERDFLAIFSTDTLPQGWKPIKWIHLTKFNETHGEILFNIMYLSCGNAKQSFAFADLAFSYFESISGKFEKRKHKKFTNKPPFLKNILHPANP